MKNDRDGPRSNPYKLDPSYCCERCVFGSGQHAEWCPNRNRSELLRETLDGIWERSPVRKLFEPGQAYELNPLNGIPIDRTPPGGDKEA